MAVICPACIALKAVWTDGWDYNPVSFAPQVKLISLLTSCGLKVDDSSLGEIIETHFNQAAHARYRSLKATIGKPRGETFRPFNGPPMQSKRGAVTRSLSTRRTCLS